MDWLKGMNDVAMYIEENLQNPTDYEALSRMVGCSVYEFFRVFSFIVGVPVAEYIRRRRLSQAVFDIQNSNEKIIEIALKYCYESPTSFTKAFKDLHGITPSAAKDNGMTLKTYPPISFKLTIKGVDEMKFRIEKRNGFTIAAQATYVDVDDMHNFTLPSIWLTKSKPKPAEMKKAEMDLDLPDGKMNVILNMDELEINLPDGKMKIFVNKDSIAAMTHTAHDGTVIENNNASFKINMWQPDVLHDSSLGVKGTDEEIGSITAAYQFSSQHGKVKVLVGSDRDIDTAIHDNCEKIPAATWAVFSFADVMTRETMAEAYARILTEWFPYSGYKRDETKPNLEKFYAPWIERAEIHPWEIWVPVLDS